jgi:hypothetical protein
LAGDINSTNLLVDLCFVKPKFTYKPLVLTFLLFYFYKMIISVEQAMQIPKKRSEMAKTAFETPTALVFKTPTVSS